MKIIIDAYGGDNSPEQIVKGAISAINEQDGFDIVLVGKEDGINALLQDETYDKTRVSIENATEVIDCNETPTEAIRVKRDSSIVKSVKLLKEDENAKAFVSAGSTGAVLTAAVILSKRIKGVVRPALSPVLPNLKGGNTMLLDCGANVDCKAIHLLQFAVMGTVYMREVYRVKNPKVALLSNGTEDKKGCALTHEAFALLKEAKGINFVGNMEARELLSGDYDVVVSDGFAGNVALKSTEGAVNVIFSALKEEIMASTGAKLGFLFMKKAFKKLKNRLDYNKKGGAVLLGMEKVVVKAHGSSKAEAFKNAVLQAYNNSSLNLNAKIGEAISALGGEQ
ncbi:MAG: phosphate acyltransferase PlsX [Clostridiales bacterium]|nr:phosphate acyltransferase PlsX [Clostridiales bacterium]